MENIKPSVSLNILKDLMILGSAKKEVKIDSFVFELVTLSEKENTELLASLVTLGDNERIISSKSYSLAMSIKKINGQDFEEIINSLDNIPDDLITMVAKKIFFVKCLQASVVNKLFEEYLKINDELEDQDKKK